MALTLYVSRTSGNKEIKRKQDFIYQILNTRSISYEEIDIADPQLDDQKQFMRQNARPESGQNVPLPPQVFLGTEYLGDYEAVHNANEVDQVFEFFRMTASKSESQESEVQNGNSEVNGSGDH